MGARVLVVDDQEEIAFPLIHTLKKEGFDVTWVDRGRAAVEIVLAELASDPPGFDLVILDLGLPDLDGLEVCQQVRAGGYVGPLMIVSARDGEGNRVAGLDYGADDYLVKPYGLAEAMARVRALLRRANVAPAATAPLSPTALTINEAARRVFVGEVEVLLTGKEFDLLRLLLANRDKVVEREVLMAKVWDDNWYGSSKTLDVAVGRLRAKLTESGTTDRVVAVRGVGFRLEGEDS